MNWKTPTRRKVLAGIGGAGALSLGGLTVMSEPSRAMQHQMEVTSAVNQTGENDLEIEWVETYRGTEQETGSVTTGDNGPIVSLANVLPGDYGSLCIKVTAKGPAEVDPRFAFRLNEEMTGENGLNEPERKLGDTAEEGELQDNIDVAIWYDNGIGGVDLLGNQNCSQDFGESLLESGASGTIKEVSDNLSDGISLTDSCLGEDESVQLGLQWEFIGEDDINRTQTDRVGFDLEFELEPCTE